MYEKRVHIRVPIGIEGSYQPITRLAAPRLGITRDISLGGARFASTERLEPGYKISLTFSLPKEGGVALTGVVVWSRMIQQIGGETGYESGLCWQNVDVHAQARLNAFLTDYTHSDGEVLFSGNLKPVPSVFWPRAAAFGLGLSMVLWMAATAWLRLFSLQSENRSLKNAVRSYQQQIGQISKRTPLPRRSP